MNTVEYVDRLPLITLPYDSIEWMNENSMILTMLMVPTVMLDKEEEILYYSIEWIY